ncbi:MAG: hypothetical protein JNK46_00205 [Methylobacteriaceae bacterium]|nr:hypothetical protein [Methylobacteriaceae bacterium]
MQRAAAQQAIVDIDAREVETLDFAATVAGERQIATALARRLADLDARRAALRRHSAELAEAGRRDRRLARGVERVAGRLDEEAARAAEKLSLEAWLDVAFGSPDAD